MAITLGYYAKVCHYVWLKVPLSCLGTYLWFLANTTSESIEEDVSVFGIVWFGKIVSYKCIASELTEAGHKAAWQTIRRYVEELVKGGFIYREKD